MTHARRIVVAIDGSQNSLRAASRSVDLARELSAELVLVHVTRSQSHSGTGRAVLEAVARSISVPVLPTLVQRHGNPAAEIVDVAEQYGAALIVIGAKGATNSSAGALGSTATGVIAHASCPIVVVPPVSMQ